MNFRHLLSILFCSALSAGAMAQTQAQVLHYGENRLEWSHFNKRAKGSGNQKAFTYAGISYAVREAENKYLVYIQSYFDTQQSWVVKNAAAPNLLVHEQFLFELTELYARKMRKAVSEFANENRNTLSFKALLEGVRDIYMTLNNELFQQQQLYNAQTRNGNDSAQQKRWNEQIKTELQKLEAFKDAQMYI